MVQNDQKDNKQEQPTFMLRNLGRSVNPIISRQLSTMSSSSIRFSVTYVRIFCANSTVNRYSISHLLRHKINCVNVCQSHVTEMGGRKSGILPSLASNKCSP